MAVIAYFWIKARFKQTHYVGMALVILACVVQIAPNITDNNCSAVALENPDADCFEAYWSPLGNGQWIRLTVMQMAMFYGLFLFSQVPAAVSNVYKQKVLQACDADVFYVSFWAGWFQILWGWLCVPLMWIPLPAQPLTVAPGETFTALANTISCIAGNVPDPATDGTCAGAPPPWVWMIFYLAFNITFNMAFTWLTKRISAQWAQVATVMCLNLVNIFGSMKFIAGNNAEPLSLYDWLGAITVSIALWVYNLEPETTADSKQATGNSAADGRANEKAAKDSNLGSLANQGSVNG